MGVADMILCPYYGTLFRYQPLRARWVSPGLIQFVGPNQKRLVRHARINANDRRFGTSPRSKESGGLRTRAEYDQTPPAIGP
jgi:hypothetical protein